jgi:U3 small nucleolar RNA-associated protein 20
MYLFLLTTCCRTAQLKVSLRPLWSPTGEAIAAVSERFGDVSWGLLFDQVKAASLSQVSESLPLWMTLDDSNEDTVSEEERSWRDPSAHKFRSSVAKRLHRNAARYAIVQVRIPRVLG